MKDGRASWLNILALKQGSHIKIPERTREKQTSASLFSPSQLAKLSWIKEA